MIFKNILFKITSLLKHNRELKFLIHKEIKFKSLLFTG